MGKEKKKKYYETPAIMGWVMYSKRKISTKNTKQNRRKEAKIIFQVCLENLPQVATPSLSGSSQASPKLFKYLMSDLRTIAVKSDKYCSNLKVRPYLFILSLIIKGSMIKKVLGCVTYKKRGCTLPDLLTRPSRRKMIYTSSPGLTPSDFCWSFIHLKSIKMVKYQNTYIYMSTQIISIIAI